MVFLRQRISQKVRKTTFSATQIDYSVTGPYAGKGAPRLNPDRTAPLAVNTNPPPQDRTCDVLVVGAGVVGCAVTRRLALEGARVVLAERAGDILEGASKGNSAILHTGFDAAPGSVEQACISEGYREFREIHGRLGLPRLESGALVLAWDEHQAERLPDIVLRAHTNGVSDVEHIGADTAAALVPGLGPGLRSAVRVPGECLVDPWSTPLAYLLQAQAHGAGFLNHCEVREGHFEGDRWRLSTSRGELRARWLVNCAGLYGDILHRRLIGKAPFTIRPRKGQFVVYDKSAGRMSGTILLPVPSETTKGIVVCPTVFGNLLVGPSSEEQESRDDTGVDREVLKRLMSVGERVLPGLKGHGVTAVYAGIRPASESRDYRILADRERHYLCLGGIRSTGLSAALGIARQACRTICADGHGYSRPERIRWPRAPQISEAGERDWMRPGNGGIVCHCELVTRREIEDALKGPLPISSLSALKRRTRVTMGRCQGFYCSAELAEITAGLLEPPMDAAMRQPAT